MSIAEVAVTGTNYRPVADIVTAMVTRKRAPIPRQRPPRRIPFYLREWRNFMGTKVADLADALDIERESYYRLEREPWRINLGEVEILAQTIGIKASQLRFPPPIPGAKQRISLDDLLEDVPENIQEIAINAVRGMVGK